MTSPRTLGPDCVQPQDERHYPHMDRITVSEPLARIITPAGRRLATKNEEGLRP